MKKLFAVILMVSMILTLMVVSVSAESVDISDEIFDVIKAETFIEITKDDVSFRYIKELTDNKYLVRYSIRGTGVTADVPHLDIGRYIFISSRPLPEVYYKGNLYEVEEAYDRGILKQQDLELMDTFTELNFTKTKISHDLDSEICFGDPDEYMHIRFEVQGSTKEVTDLENWEDDISGAYDKLEDFQETLHEKLINETLKNYDHIDIHHSQGISVVAVKRDDVKKIAEDEFVEYMSYLDKVHVKFIETYTPYMKDYRFEKVRYGVDENGDESYVLIKAYGPHRANTYIGFRYGDVVVDCEGIYGPFPFKYGLYDVKEDKVYDIFDLRVTPDKYYGLQEDLVEVAGACLVGDRDRDGVISVMDATGIQLMLAGIKGEVYDDYYSSPKGDDSGYVTDVDRDGEVSVMDATAIQMKLAQKN